MLQYFQYLDLVFLNIRINKIVTKTCQKNIFRNIAITRLKPLRHLRTLSKAFEKILQLQELLSLKGQTISKADYGVLNSPKSECWHNFQYIKLSQHYFFGRIKETINCTRDLKFRLSKKHTNSSTWFGRLLSKHEEDCSKFCVLLRKSELY